jgi:hypothetical protein
VTRHCGTGSSGSRHEEPHDEAFGIQNAWPHFLVQKRSPQSGGRSRRQSVTIDPSVQNSFVNDEAPDEELRTRVVKVEEGIHRHSS